MSWCWTHAERASGRPFPQRPRNCIDKDKTFPFGEIGQDTILLRQNGMVAVVKALNLLQRDARVLRHMAASQLLSVAGHNF
mmetsp:Transcript_61942/g.115822  ORF Transcript_61942/g.115822 Transcript_61942/m.115822 type:complete len:81 (-) Transcript_61942:564-806(-)